VSRSNNSWSGGGYLFHYNAASPIPVHVQIEEQVKVALALGKLRPGDMLPSIRNVEDRVGVGRMLVRRAYQELQDAGLVRITHGRGAVVIGQRRANGALTQKSEAMIQRMVADMRREGLEPVTFSRVLHQRLLEEDARSPRVVCVDSSEVLARELGQQIQLMLGVNVTPFGIARLRRYRKRVTDDTQVLVDYYYLSDVRRILTGRTRGIYPIALDYDPSFVERLRSLPLHSSVLLLFYERSLKETGTRLAIDALIDRLKDRHFKIEIKAIEAVGSLERLARARYEVIVVSNRVWDGHTETLERWPAKFVRLASRVNQPSLDEVRDRLGFVI
jgi:DNA-binding transcriptional regulator YhcF (GntR family)